MAVQPGHHRSIEGLVPRQIGDQRPSHATKSPGRERGEAETDRHREMTVIASAAIRQPRLQPLLDRPHDGDDEKGRTSGANTGLACARRRGDQHRRDNSGGGLQPELAPISGSFGLSVIRDCRLHHAAARRNASRSKRDRRHILPSDVDNVPAAILATNPFEERCHVPFKSTLLGAGLLAGLLSFSAGAASPKPRMSISATACRRRLPSSGSRLSSATRIIRPRQGSPIPVTTRNRWRNF